MSYYPSRPQRDNLAHSAVVVLKIFAWISIAGAAVWAVLPFCMMAQWSALPNATIGTLTLFMVYVGGILSGVLTWAIFLAAASAVESILEVRYSVAAIRTVVEGHAEAADERREAVLQTLTQALPAPTRPVEPPSTPQRRQARPAVFEPQQVPAAPQKPYPTPQLELPPRRERPVSPSQAPTQMPPQPPYRRPRVRVVHAEEV